MDNILNNGGKYVFLFKNIAKQMYEWGLDMDVLNERLAKSQSFTDAYKSIVNIMEESPIYEAEDIEKSKHQIVENIFQKLMDDMTINVPYHPTGGVSENTRYKQSTHGGIYKVDVNTIDVDFKLVRNVETEDYQDCQRYLDPENYDKVRITISRGTPDDIINNINYIIENINEHALGMDKEDIKLKDEEIFI